MNFQIRAFTPVDTLAAIEIWNEVVREGRAFPQEDELTLESGQHFFSEQSYTGLAIDAEKDRIVGLYILHPNNIGRCGHISNASYAVRFDARGCGVGEALVLDCLQKAKEMGFGILQFNAVVKSNVAALALYKKLGFVQLGTVPGGFRNKDGVFEDIIPHYYVL